MTPQELFSSHNWTNPRFSQAFSIPHLGLKAEPVVRIRVKLWTSPGAATGQREPIPCLEFLMDPIPCLELLMDPIPWLEFQKDPIPWLDFQRDPIPWLEFQRDPIPWLDSRIKEWILIPWKPLARVPLLLVRSHSALCSSRTFGRSFLLPYMKLFFFWMKLSWESTDLFKLKQRQQQFKKNSQWKNKITSYNDSVLSRYNKISDSKYEHTLLFWLCLLH